MAIRQQSQDAWADARPDTAGPDAARPDAAAAPDAPDAARGGLKSKQQQQQQQQDKKSLAVVCNDLMHLGFLSFVPVAHRLLRDC